MPKTPSGTQRVGSPRLVSSKMQVLIVNHWSNLSPAGLSFDDWASNTRLHQSRNHGGTRLIGSRRLLRSKSVLCRFTRSRVLSEGDKRDSKSHMPGGTRLNLKPEPHVPHRGRSYFAPEPASRTRPRRIHSRSAGCEEMLLVGNCREL